MRTILYLCYYDLAECNLKLGINVYAHYRSNPQVYNRCGDVLA
jgi:hypothetical protein